MGLKKLAAKVTEYNQRLEQGKASKIEPDHVRRVLEKLLARKEELETSLAATDLAEKKTRISHKLEVAKEQIARAKWLLAEIE